MACCYLLCTAVGGCVCKWACVGDPRDLKAQRVGRAHGLCAALEDRVASRWCSVLVCIGQNLRGRQTSSHSCVTLARQLGAGVWCLSCRFAIRQAELRTGETRSFRCSRAFFLPFFPDVGLLKKKRDTPHIGEK